MSRSISQQVEAFVRAKSGPSTDGGPWDDSWEYPGLPPAKRKDLMAYFHYELAIAPGISAHVEGEHIVCRPISGWPARTRVEVYMLADDSTRSVYTGHTGRESKRGVFSTYGVVLRAFVFRPGFDGVQVGAPIPINDLGGAEIRKARDAIVATVRAAFEADYSAGRKKSRA